jgi:nucleoside-diphosphate-sugar epimerase
MTNYLVVGAGPVGSNIATKLAEDGHAVRVLTRSGTGPQHPNITLLKGDGADAAFTTSAAFSASAIFNCVNPPYHRWAQDWPPIHRSLLAAAESTGAVLAMMDNLYAFGPGTAMPMTERSAMLATGTKGAIRRMMAEELLAAHAEKRVVATLVRASDFFGPGVTGSAFGERVLPKIIAGNKVGLLGALDVAHSVSYMPDVAATMIAAATNDAAWGQAWQVPNSPAKTQREIVQGFATAAGTMPKVSALPKIALTVLGLFVPVMRELKETWYQFAEPWVTDSAATVATLGVSATPFDEAASATVAWWKQRDRSKPTV